MCVWVQHAVLDKEPTWSDDTTRLIHEDQTLRAELVHEAGPRKTAWTFAAYETPVSDRMRHLTLTGSTPEPLLQTLLISLTHGDARETSVGSPVTEETVAAATRPRIDAGWKHTVDGRFIRWETAQGDAGVQFDAFAAQNSHTTTLTTWTLWSGPDINQPTWAIHASPYTPARSSPPSPKTSHTAPAPTAHSAPAHRKTTPPGLPPVISTPSTGRQP